MPCPGTSLISRRGAEVWCPAGRNRVPPTLLERGGGAQAPSAAASASRQQGDCPAPLCKDDTPLEGQLLPCSPGAFGPGLRPAGAASAPSSAGELANRRWANAGRGCRPALRAELRFPDRAPGHTSLRGPSMACWPRASKGPASLGLLQAGSPGPTTASPGQRLLQGWGAPPPPRWFPPLHSGFKADEMMRRAKQFREVRTIKPPPTTRLLMNVGPLSPPRSAPPPARP